MSFGPQAATTLAALAGFAVAAAAGADHEAHPLRGWGIAAFRDDVGRCNPTSQV